MKIRNLLILLLFLCQKLFSQTKNWSVYDLDSIVSIEMPFTVYEIDTIIKYSKLYQIYSEGDSSKFIVQKSYFGKQYSNIASPTLPTNEKNLNKYYLDVMNLIDEMIGYDLDSRKKIKKNNLKGYQLTYKNGNGKKIHKINLFFVNKNLYSFSYFNENGLDEIEKDTFFNSIIFDEKKNLLQYPNSTTSTIKKVVLGLFIILFISFIFRLKSKRKIHL